METKIRSNASSPELEAPGIRVRPELEEFVPPFPRHTALARLRPRTQSSAIRDSKSRQAAPAASQDRLQCNGSPWHL